MGLAAEKFSANTPAQMQDTGRLAEVIHLNQHREQVDGMGRIREKIEFIARSSRDKELINDEVFKGYMDLAKGNIDEEFKAELTPEKLENMYKFALDHEKKAENVYTKIAEARVAGYVSEDDEAFLKKHLGVTKLDFDERADWYATRVDEKLANMKRDKARYIKFLNHKFIKDVDSIKLDNKKISVPKTEAELMKYNAKQRRAIVEELWKALIKAEKYSSADDQKSEKLTKAYIGRLNGAMSQKIIGQKTYNEFLAGFEVLNKDEKEYWLSEFDAQMEPRELLWKQTRKSLKGKALKDIEDKRDEIGYSDLLAEFKEAKLSESERLIGGYEGVLDKFQEKGWIGDHTRLEFIAWMETRDLSEQYTAKAKLPGQMKYYEKLWDDIEELDEDQQEFLRQKQQDINWGYTELKAQYDAFASGQTLSEADTLEAERQAILTKASSAKVRTGIEDSGEIFEKKGSAKKKGFLNVLKGMILNAGSSKKFDAGSYEGAVRERASKQEEQERKRNRAVRSNITLGKLKKKIKGRGVKDEVDMDQVSDDVGLMEKMEGGRMTQREGFIDVQTNEGSRTHHETYVSIDEEGAMTHFLTGAANINQSEIGKEREISLSVDDVEMDLREIKILKEYLEKEYLEVEAGKKEKK